MNSTVKPRELHIFDFDGTLFRSPPAPADFGPGWWDDPQSLGPPCVPQKPGAEWFVSPVVSAFRKADSNPQAITVVMTGRVQSFYKRVKEILTAGGISPDELFLKSTSGSTEAYKILHMRYLVKQMPSIQVIEFWEDRHHHLAAFQTAAERMGYRFVAHPVKTKDQLACARVEDLPAKVARLWLER